MEIEDVILIIGQIINFVALGICVHWIRALKATVETQQQTIASLKALLDTADSPKMLERLEAYKRFGDHEKEFWKAVRS